MASTWGDSWSVAWGVSWDIGGPEPETVYGGRYIKGELFKPRVSKTYHNGYPEAVHKSAVVLARSGGHARAASLSKNQRVNIATNAAKARWK